MPHIPDLRAHDAHDPELVAAFAAGDATGADLETATALVSGCAACAALHHDLRAIAAAMPALPAPVRPRDFRLTPEQAASLRPTGWRRLLGTLAGPSFRFAAPLGTGLAALGLAGILVGSFASVPLGAGGAATARDEAAQVEATELPQASGAPAAAAPSAPEPIEQPIRTSADGAGASADPNELYAGQESPGVDTAAGGAGAASPAIDGEVEGAAPAVPSQDPGPVVGDDPASLEDGAATLRGSTGELLAITGAAALLVGLTLLALRWTSRHIA